MKSKSCLWDKFGSDDGVVVYTQSCVESEPVCDVLSEVGIGCNFVDMLAFDDVAFAVFGEVGLCACGFVCIPCRTSKVLPVDADSGSVAVEELCALVVCESTDVIVVFVEDCSGCFSCSIAIVDAMVSPVEVYAQRAIGVCVAIVEADACQGYCRA